MIKSMNRVLVDDKQANVLDKISHLDRLSPLSQKKKKRIVCLLFSSCPWRTEQEPKIRKGG